MECVYEPPQENYPEGFDVLEDPKADTVEALAGLLGLKRVSKSRVHDVRARARVFNVLRSCVYVCVCVVDKMVYPVYYNQESEPQSSFFRQRGDWKKRKRATRSMKQISTTRYLFFLARKISAVFVLCTPLCSAAFGENRV